MTTFLFWYLTTGAVIATVMLALMLIAERIREEEGPQSDMPEARVPIWICVLTVPFWPYTLAQMVRGLQT